MLPKGADYADSYKIEGAAGIRLCWEYCMKSIVGVEMFRANTFCYSPNNKEISTGLWYIKVEKMGMRSESMR